MDQSPALELETLLQQLHAARVRLAELETLEVERRLLRSQLVDAEQRVARGVDLEAALRDASLENERLIAEVQRLRAEVKAYHRSLSWHATRALRTAAARVRRARRSG